MQEDIIGKFKKIIKKPCPYCKHEKYELREISKHKVVYGKDKDMVENIFHCKNCGEIWSAEHRTAKKKSAKWVGGAE